MAVANGRQRFHAKEKSIEKRPGRHLGDGVWVQHVQRSKYKIDKEVDPENKGGETQASSGSESNGRHLANRTAWH